MMERKLITTEQELKEAIENDPGFVPGHVTNLMIVEAWKDEAIMAWTEGDELVLKLTDEEE